MDVAWRAGNLYCGEWKEDRRHGQGTYSFVSGELYVGQWEMNKKHGKGRFEYASGMYVCA
jgi:hypothetical protein